MSNDILIVDDESDIRTVLCGILEDEGYSTREAATSEQALKEINERLPNLIILDIWLRESELDGVEILQWLKDNYSSVPVIMISGHGNIETAVNSIKAGAYDFIEKPFQADKLILLVQRALEAEGLRQENLELRKRIGASDRLIGESQLISQLNAAINKVAPGNSRILITGPPGSGKEVVSRAIHAKSGRIHRPFIVLNCANMNPDRLEIELFGISHTANISTFGSKVGVFERAHTGTLFLDEISDMPIETQGKIVRVLQEQKFIRVGGDKEVHVNVRVISSTNKNLQEEIAKGRFREDLFYRLSVVPMQVPALNQRRDDIPVLTRFFLHETAESSGMPIKCFSDEAMALLQAYDWPGNVRQLKNIIDWILIMYPDNTITTVTADMLPPELKTATPVDAKLVKNMDVLTMSLRKAREHFEREYLFAQVNRFGGNISQTASFIGMERSALHRKLKTLGVNQEEQPVKLVENSK